MVEYIELKSAPKRKEIIGQFKITDRDGRAYSNIAEAVEDALKRAFLDINFRTLDRSDEYPALNADEKITSFLIDKLKEAKFLDRFFEFFSEDNNHYANEPNFDAWHHETCTIFLNVIDKYYKNAAYGKAQKIVNMMFKHLYCMNFGKKEKEDKSDWKVLNEEYFKHCHLTLDSFTLEWFCREVAEKWYNKLEKSVRGDQITKGKIDAWSNINYKDFNENTENTSTYRLELYFENAEVRKVTQKEYYHYSFFVDIIREFFEKTSSKILNCRYEKEHTKRKNELEFTCTAEQKRYAKYTPFQAEFFIWPEIQLHLTAESLFSQSIGQADTFDILENYLKEHNLGEEKLHKDFITAKENPSQTDITKKANASFKVLPLEAKMKIVKEKVTCILTYCKQNNL